MNQRGGYGDQIQLPQVQVPKIPGNILRGGLIILILLIMALTSFYTVDPEEVGIVLRFGRYVRTTDPGLHFLRPMFNSLSRDYISELAQLRVPWLAMYGERDPIVNVSEAIENIHQYVHLTQNGAVEIVLIENVGHSFANPETGEWVHNEYIVLNWLAEKLGIGI